LCQQGHRNPFNAARHGQAHDRDICDDIVCASLSYPALREENTVAKDRLLNGLHKLTETNALVDGMKVSSARGT
jgi:hypothetical protein